MGLSGMAATKCIISMRKWAFTEFGSEKVLTFIAMATDEDLAANAEFIRLADSFVQVPAGKNVNNYKNVKLICKIAQERFFLQRQPSVYKRSFRVRGMEPLQGPAFVRIVTTINKQKQTNT